MGLFIDVRIATQLVGDLLVDASLADCSFGAVEDL